FADRLEYEPVFPSPGQILTEIDMSFFWFLLYCKFPLLMILGLTGAFGTCAKEVSEYWCTCIGIGITFLAACFAIYSIYMWLAGLFT
ncbi:MAG TPA: hypothetical protein PKW73_03730, partial [Candidatus Obscuribacter sp.]|nr:hypothetical protein [Candidatus Obscuribacter sp.]